MRKQNSKMNKQVGFTIFEILIVASIIAIVAAVVVPTLTEVKDKNVTVTQELTLMRTAISNIDDRYWDEPITATLTNQEMIEARILPTAYRKTGTNIYNLFGGEIVITGVPDNGLTWASQGVPNSICSKLVDDGKTLGFEEVQIGATTLVYSVTNNAAITQACLAAEGSGGTPDTVTVTWIRAEN